MNSIKLLLIAAIAAISMTFIGCTTNQPCTDYHVPSQHIQNSARSGFNEETYVWEQLMFPTNRTSGVQ